MSITKVLLSERDEQVLQSIFNPLELTSVAEQSQRNNDLLDKDVEGLFDEVCDDESTLIMKSRSFEREAVKLIESNKDEFHTALEKFAMAIELSPDRPSIYNNRAQALRLVGDDDASFTDLNKAIDLCNPKLQRTLCHALCQRGLLYRKRDNLDAARADFVKAAELGSKFAKHQLVEINPYSALCNQMLRQAFEQLK